MIETLRWKLRRPLLRRIWRRVFPKRAKKRTVVTPGGERIVCHEVQYLGHPFVFPATSEVGAAISRGWDWDQVLRPILAALLTSDDPTICEVGSNIGASVLEMLAEKPGARVTCYEPSDRYRALLERNLAAAGHSDVQVRGSLVSREPGTGHIYTDETSGGMYPLDHLTRAQPAEIVTLDAEFAGRDEPLQFLKTDTDGNDIEVLRGAEGLLRSDRPVLFVEFCPLLMQSDPVADLVWLQSLGYTTLVCLDHLGFHVGTTTDAAQAVRWSRDLTYCDILTAADGTDLAGRLADVRLSPRTNPVPPVPA